jgi:CO/xanthine dehydrogenase Mo-binding subunit
VTLRLIKSTTEFEGRFFETWSLVDDEDVLESWAADAALVTVGSPLTRFDGPARVAGSARYTVDVAPPGMLYGGILRSPISRGRLIALDLDAARAVPGVRCVLGPGDTPPITDEAGRQPDTPALAKTVEFAGQSIAAVAADTGEAATRALAALAPVFEELTPIVDPQSALLDMRFEGEPVEHARGDADAAFASADVTIELTIDTPGHLHVPLETHAAVADWRHDGLTVWLSTQGMFAARETLAAAFGLPKEQVRVISEYVGGGFGAKLTSGTEPIVAAELSRRTGRPVRVVNDRHAEQLDGGRRSSTRQTVRLGARADGTLVATDVAAVVAVGDGGLMSAGMATGVLTLSEMLYACENVTGAVFPVRTSLRGPNAFRAPGVMEATAAFEQAIDELASALGRDPLDLRRQLHVDYDQMSGLPYSAKHLLECYDRAATLSDWANRDQLRAPQADGRLRGLGCASQIWFGVGGPPVNVKVRIASDGHVTVETGIQDTGTGTPAAARLIAAEEIGVPVEQVTVRAGDTSRGHYGPVAGGSMTTASVMPAVRSAAARARNRLLQVAADVFEVPQADLFVAEGAIRSRDGEIEQPIGEAIGKLGNAVIEAIGNRGPNADGVRLQTFGCQIAQVAVDPAVGEVVVEKIWAVHDVGRIVNPLAASSQVEGGILQGLGFALSEEVIVDPTTGVPVTGTLDDYKLPTIADAPELTVEFVDIADTTAGNIGAKGLGEPPIIPTAAAIANAFAHATGRRVPALPLTRARVLETLR